jgi:hypothetical protein
VGTPIPTLVTKGSGTHFMLSRLASAQKDDSNRRHQHKNADDLKRQIVIAEKQRANIANVVGRGSRKRWKRLTSGLEVAETGG